MHGDEKSSRFGPWILKEGQVHCGLVIGEQGSGRCQSSQYQSRSTRKYTELFARFGLSDHFYGSVGYFLDRFHNPIGYLPGCFYCPVSTLPALPSSLCCLAYYIAFRTHCFCVLFCKIFSSILNYFLPRIIMLNRYCRSHNFFILVEWDKTQTNSFASSSRTIRYLQMFHSSSMASCSTRCMSWF